MLDYQYFKDRYQLIVVYLSKENELDADSRSVQYIEFCGMLETNSQVCTVLEKLKRNSLTILQRNIKIFARIYICINGWIQ